MRFAGRRVVVTGASRGLGAELARAFAAEGAWVGLGCRTGAAGANEVLAGIRQAGGDGDVLCFDVRDPVATLGPVAPHVLVNNAAVSGGDGFDAVIDVGLRGAVACTEAVLPAMVARRSGAVVNIASVAGLRGVAGHSAYSAAKGGLLAWTRAIAAEHASSGVRVNAVVPGLLNVGMGDRVPPATAATWLAQVPLGRRGTASEVAAAVLFLASDEASYVIGQAVGVDGGLST